MVFCWFGNETLTPNRQRCAQIALRHRIDLARARGRAARGECR
jgi:hypothetical protein